MTETARARASATGMASNQRLRIDRISLDLHLIYMLLCDHSYWVKFGGLVEVMSHCESYESLPSQLSPGVELCEKE